MKAGHHLGKLPPASGGLAASSGGKVAPRAEVRLQRSELRGEELAKIGEAFRRPERFEVAREQAGHRPPAPHQRREVARGKQWLEWMLVRHPVEDEEAGGGPLQPPPPHHPGRPPPSAHEMHPPPPTQPLAGERAGARPRSAR